LHLVSAQVQPAPPRHHPTRLSLYGQGSTGTVPEPVSAAEPLQPPPHRPSAACCQTWNWQTVRQCSHTPQSPWKAHSPGTGRTAHSNQTGNQETLDAGQPTTRPHPCARPSGRWRTLQQKACITPLLAFSSPISTALFSSLLFIPFSSLLFIPFPSPIHHGQFGLPSPGSSEEQRPLCLPAFKKRGSSCCCHRRHPYHLSAFPTIITHTQP